MKGLCISLALIAAIGLSAQKSFAAWEVFQTPISYISYLNPLPYIGIGENRTNFSLNPFSGFKNCDTCKRVAYCGEMNTCNTCQKALQKCNSCEHAVTIPKCTSCGR